MGRFERRFLGANCGNGANLTTVVVVVVVLVVVVLVVVLVVVVVVVVDVDVVVPGEVSGSIGVCSERTTGDGGGDDDGEDGVDDDVDDDSDGEFDSGMLPDDDSMWMDREKGVGWVLFSL
jgi:hypothetical protein